MATFTLDELITPLTAAEVEQSHYDALAAVGVTTTTWKTGAVTRTMIAIASVILGALSSLISNIARSGFLALSSGLWARLNARYVYAVEAQDATFATGDVLITNPTGGIYAYAPGDLILEASATGKQYQNLLTVNVGSLAVNVVASMQALEAGAASSALVGEIDTVVSQPVLTCTNAAVIIGLDDEDTSLLVTRCSEKLGSFSPNGPADAYLVAARGALRVNGSNVGINRIRTKPTNRCGITVYVATASGAVLGTIGDVATDLGAVDAAIQTQAVPQCVTADILSATPKIFNITASVWVYNNTGLTEIQVRAAITEALENYFKDPISAPIGGHSAGTEGYIWAEDLSAAIMRATVNGADIRAFRAIVTPSAATLVDTTEVPVLGTVTLTVTRQAPPSGGV